VRPWILYSVIRLGLFAVTFIVLMLIGVPWLWSTLAAAAIGFSVSYIFFREQRDAVAQSIVARRVNGETNPDEDEDSAIDRQP
jgi:ABC-type bacteriocin/lantibiotic exporter with double-glycine peptidase domain